MPALYSVFSNEYNAVIHGDDWVVVGNRAAMRIIMCMTFMAGHIHSVLRYTLVLMLGIALRGAEAELPNLHFLMGSSVAQLRLRHASPGVDVRLGEADVILIDEKIVRVSLIDMLDVDDRQAFPEDGNLYKRIKFLSVINCSVKQRIPDYIADLTELVHLDLSKNGIGGSIDNCAKQVFE